MGYFLIYESMLDSVLYARDKWLNPGGLVIKNNKKQILPDKAVINIAGIEDNNYKKSKSQFWDNVYGINMDVIKPCVFKEPLVDVAKKNMINTNICKIFEINLHTVTKEQLDFAHNYELTFVRNDTFNGLVTWFDIEFGGMPNLVTFSTGKNFF